MTGIRSESETAVDAATEAPTGVLDLDREPWMALANYAIKVALFVSFFIAIVIPPEVVAGKAIGFRAPLFLASAILVPIIAKARGWRPYPHTADALLAAPFLVDTLGNLLGFYDAYLLTDDVLHVLNLSLIHI